MQRQTIPNMNDPYSSQTPEIIWAAAFARHLKELENGLADLHHLIDLGYELYPTLGHRDPKEVAEAEFRGEN